jgi:CRP/FNR family cyclic AMP-dependent transcriptional regulator
MAHGKEETMTEINVKCLEVIPLFTGLKREALEPLCAGAHRVTLSAGEILFQQGDPGETMYLIEEGRVTVYTHGADNQEIVLDILGPDQVIGELALLDGKPRSATVRALTDCQLLALDRGPFMAHLRQNPETAIHLLDYLSGNLRQRVLQAEAASVSDSTARLAQVLLFLAERNGAIEPGLVTSALHIKDLAAAIGTSEEWVSQMLNEWCRDGIIGMTGPRRLLLHHVEALKVLSRRDD